MSKRDHSESDSDSNEPTFKLFKNDDRVYLDGLLTNLESPVTKQVVKFKALSHSERIF